MSTYSAMLWTVIFPPHPPYPQPSFACWWLGRFLCRLQFVLSLQASPLRWRAAWRRHSGASTQPQRESAWPVGETLGPKRGTGMWQSCAPATDRQVSSQTQHMPKKKWSKNTHEVDESDRPGSYSFQVSVHLTCVTPTRTSLLTEPPPFNISPPLFRKPDPPRRKPVAMSSSTSSSVARFTFWRITAKRIKNQRISSETKNRSSELL